MTQAVCSCGIFETRTKVRRKFAPAYLIYATGIVGNHEESHKEHITGCSQERIVGPKNTAKQIEYLSQIMHWI
jgi:hypothetical protein